MKTIHSFIIFVLFFPTINYAQNFNSDDLNVKSIYKLIDDYADARETKDTIILASILTENIDQLVSSGRWRRGKSECMQGMLRSSNNNPGTRKLTIDHIRFLNAEGGIVDARYEIHNSNGNIRKMWSCFIVVKENGIWKITGIRNMLPAG